MESYRLSMCDTVWSNCTPPTLILYTMPDFWRSEPIAHSVILCTMAKQKDHLRTELRSTKIQRQVLTRTPKLQAMSTNSATT